MRKMAHTIKVTKIKYGKQESSGERGELVQKFEIDGEEFPWYIDVKGVRVDVGRGDAPTVTVAILADRVELIHALTDEDLDPEGPEFP